MVSIVWSKSESYSPLPQFSHKIKRCPGYVLIWLDKSLLKYGKYSVGRSEKTKRDYVVFAYIIRLSHSLCQVSGLKERVFQTGITCTCTVLVSSGILLIAFWIMWVDLFWSVPHMLFMLTLE